MNNNRGNNNRRRGRGNNRPQGGGGQQLNRIDSRARGNAPQLLEKYRKLAQDAHMNGDRVTAEYYLQFADHYFRVLADARLRQEEQRMRRDDRWQEGSDGFREDGDDSDFSVEDGFPTFDQPVYQRREREDREQGGRDGNRDGGRDGNRDSGRDQGYRDQNNRDQNGNRDSGREAGGREWRNRRDERPAREEPAERDVAVEDGERGANPYEPSENPFLRPNRARALRAQREDGQERGSRAEGRGEGRAEGRERAPRRSRSEAAPANPEPAESTEPVGLDPSLLPPAIGRESPESAEPALAPRRRTRRKPGADGDETLQSVG